MRINWGLWNRLRNPWEFCWDFEIFGILPLGFFARKKSQIPAILELGSQKIPSRSLLWSLTQSVVLTILEIHVSSKIGNNNGDLANIFLIFFELAQVGLISDGFVVNYGLKIAYDGIFVPCDDGFHLDIESDSCVDSNECDNEGKSWTKTNKLTAIIAFKIALEPHRL